MGNDRYAAVTSNQIEIMNIIAAAESATREGDENVEKARNDIAMHATQLTSV